eukprot:GHVU01216193.1.p1 GENE.GHVU01216193.1~~GHVU01216193.1.p1  ORF type:complete len:125 (+),score=1.74 GHVU01216193.1:153-527(+)
MSHVCTIEPSAAEIKSDIHMGSRCTKRKTRSGAASSQSPGAIVIGNFCTAADSSHSYLCPVCLHIHLSVVFVSQPPSSMQLGPCHFKVGHALESQRSHQNRTTVRWHRWMTKTHNAMAYNYAYA